MYMHLHTNANLNIHVCTSEFNRDKTIHKHIHIYKQVDQIHTSTQRNMHTQSEKTLLTNASPHRKGTYESIYINETGIHTYTNPQIQVHGHSYTSMHLYMWAKMHIH